jgi:hypothetical protein
MGVIRKTLMVPTLGIVKGSSKKQRVAKATMKSARATASNTAQANVILQQQAKAERAANVILQQQAEAESAFRYSTDPVYREYIDAQRAEAARAAAAEAARRAAQHKRNAEVGWGLATYLALMVAFAVVVFVWSAQALFSAARSQPRNLWKQDALGTAWRSAGRRIREAG